VGYSHLSRTGSARVFIVGAITSTCFYRMTIFHRRGMPPRKPLALVVIWLQGLFRRLSVNLLIWCKLSSATRSSIPDFSSLRDRSVASKDSLIIRGIFLTLLRSMEQRTPICWRFPCSFCLRIRAHYHPKPLERC
jgi:hypothetical protein